MNVSRRRLLATGALAAVGSLTGCTADEADWSWDGELPVTAAVQYHSPTCACCSEYADYLERNGIDLTVEERDGSQLAGVKRGLGVPREMESCHTVDFGDYVVEGHVPLEAVEELFDAGSAFVGVSIPGMPENAPGMGPPGDDPLDVYAFDEDGYAEPL